MPSQWGSRRLNIVSQGSPTGTQALQAVGCAEAALLYRDITAIPDREARFHDDEVTYVSVGDGATSEGEFWESLNTACSKRLPLLYLVEDNGYAISVPVDVQMPGGNIARLVASFPHLTVREIDGTDFLESYGVLGDIIAQMRTGAGPALIRACVTRPYSHSLSDDERLYKTREEREREAARDPLTRMSRLMIDAGLVSEPELAEIAASVDR